MPEPSLWRSWSALVDERLAPFLPTEVVQHRGQTVIIMGLARNGRSRVPLFR